MQNLSRSPTIRIDFSRLQFLVADDNAHMRRILRTFLHNFGSREVYEAEDGAAALDVFEQHRPDIIIIDWAMPVFDGIDLVKMIRQPGSKTNPFVPIVMLTGHTDKERVIAARDAGVTEILAKPLSAKALYQRILNVVINPRPFIKTKTYFGPDQRRNVTGPERRSGDSANVIQPPPPTNKIGAIGLDNNRVIPSRRSAEYVVIDDTR